MDISALLTPPDIFACKKILCIQPHPDDNEVGMGGIIAVLAQRGCEIHYLTVTNGGLGSPSPSVNFEDTVTLRHDEAIAAGRCLGAAEFHFLTHDDGTLQDVPALTEEIVDVIRKVQPDAVFCPDPWLCYESHYDHVTTGRASANAVIMAGLHSYPKNNTCAPWTPSAIGFYFTSKPNTVVDISAVFDRKFEALALHKSQMPPETIAMYRLYFQMKGAQLANGKGFALGEGLKVLSPLHLHCFVDAANI